MSVGRPSIKIDNENDYGFSPKKKSAAHHMMFDNTQAPWGVTSPTAIPPNHGSRRSLERPGQG